jgi:hypothetical protein
MAKALAKFDFGEGHNVGEEDVARAEHLADRAASELASEFRLLHGHSLVGGVWAAFETMVVDLVTAWLLDRVHDFALRVELDPEAGAIALGNRSAQMRQTARGRGAVVTSSSTAPASLRTTGAGGGRSGFPKPRSTTSTFARRMVKVSSRSRVSSYGGSVSMRRSFIRL